MSGDLFGWPEVRQAGRPLPEALGDERGGGWVVEPMLTGGSTDLEGRVMRVTAAVGPCPVCGDCHGERVRGHEMCHAAISPDLAEVAEVGAVRDFFVDGAEEVRVNRFQRMVGAGGGNRAICSVPDAYEHLLPPPGVPEVAATPADAIRLLIAGQAVIYGLCATGGSVDEAPWVAAMGRRYRGRHPLRRLFVAARAEVLAALGEYGDRSEAGRRAARLSGRLALPACVCVPERAGRCPRCSAGFISAEVKGRGAWGPLAPRGFRWSVALGDRLRGLFEAFCEGALGGTRPGGTGRPASEVDEVEQVVRWASMRLESPDLTVPAARPPWRLRRFDEVGAVPTRPERLTSDLRVFAPRRRRAGGAVLIDGSGSMSWGSEDLREVVEAAPAAVVGLYGLPEYGEGVLVVVARDGFMVPKVPEVGPGNGVDGPALRWLATLPGPRVWVSDGAATGPNDSWTSAHEREALAVCRAAGAARVETLGGLLEALAEGHRSGRPFDLSDASESHRPCRFDVLAGGE